MSKRNLTGQDADLETSLAEYGLAWETKENEMRFYYGIERLIDTGKNTSEFYFSGFDWSLLPLDVDVYKEYDWVEFDQVLSFVGMSKSDWDKQPLEQKVSDLLDYYGFENVFGSSYGIIFTLEELLT